MLRGTGHKSRGWRQDPSAEGLHWPQLFVQPTRQILRCTFVPRAGGSVEIVLELSLNPGLGLARAFCLAPRCVGEKGPEGQLRDQLRLGWRTRARAGRRRALPAPRGSRRRTGAGSTPRLVASRSPRRSEEERGSARDAKPPNACDSVPLFSPASTITVASLTNAMVLLRRGKFDLCGGVPGVKWDTTRWSCMIVRCRGAFSRGYERSKPDPITAMMRPPLVAIADWCAAVSTPRARPLTTVTPRQASHAASFRARRAPSSDGCRVPTIETRTPS